MPRQRVKVFMKATFLLLCLMAGAIGPELSFGQMETLPVPPALVTVTGEYKARFMPDQLTFSIGVHSEGEDLLKAKQENAASVRDIVDYLKQRGVEAKDIQTQYLSIGVRYQDPQQLQVRYVADQQIQVMLRKVDGFDEINTGLLQRGVTAINGPNFGYSNAESVKTEARAKAVVDARTKAQALAGALGQPIGPAYSITDIDAPDYGPVAYRMSASSMESGPGIATGEIEIVHRVNVAFYLFAK